MSCRSLDHRITFGGRSLFGRPLVYHPLQVPVACADIVHMGYAAFDLPGLQ